MSINQRHAAQKLGCWFDNSDVLFFIAYGMWLFSSLVSATMLEPGFIAVRKIFTYGAMILAVIYELKWGKWSYRELAGLLVVVLFGISFIKASVMAMFQGAILIYCGRRIELRRILRFSLTAIAVFLSSIIVLSLAGMVYNYVTDDGLRIRNFLGFRYALYPSEFLFAITCMVLAVKGGVLSKIDVCLLITANVVVFLLTGSRLAFLSSMAVVLGYQMLALFNGFRICKSDVWKCVCWCAYGGAAIFSIVVTLSFNSSTEWMAFLDGRNVFAGRLSMGHAALVDYGVSPFGQHVAMNGASVDGFGQRDYSKPYFYIDNLYVQLFVRFGLFPTLVFIVLMTAATVAAWRRSDASLAFVLIVVALHSIVQDYMLLLVYNPFLFALGGLAVQSHTESESSLSKKGAQLINARER